LFTGGRRVNEDVPALRCGRYAGAVAVSFDAPDDHPHVAVVTIDRPERANSLDPATLGQLAGAWRRIAADPEIRCAVLTGSGDRVFCGGMDMKTTIPAAQRFALGERVPDDVFEGLRSVSTALLAGFDLGTPLVCAINGHARAGGFDLMLASEIRYAVPQATFALEEVGLGLYPTGNATVLLPRQIGWAHAHDLLLTARPIDAERACAIGLVNEVVAPADLMTTALATADAIANNAPLAVTATRAGVRELLSLDLPHAYERQEELGRPLRKTEDAREAQRAFVEKRKPVFRGR
jgi:enoyl-CoA hydratase/carnithine racemase